MTINATYRDTIDSNKVEERLVFGDSDGYVYEFIPTIKTDDGSAITGTHYTKVFDLGMPDTYKRWPAISIVAKGTGVTVDWETDDGGFTDNNINSPSLANCVALWKMNDNTSTTTVVDSMGLYNGTAQQYTFLLHTTGKVGTGALTFNGEDDYIDTGQTFQSVFRDSFTINAWANLQNRYGNAQNTICGVIDAINHNGVAITYGDDITDYVGISYYVNGVGIISFLPAAAIYDNWTMVTLVVNNLGTSATASVYLNGSFVGSSTGIVDMSLFDVGSNNLFIGNYNFNGLPYDGQYSKGSLDNFLVFSKALSQAEIDLLYNNGSGTESFDAISLTDEYEEYTFYINRTSKRIQFKFSGNDFQIRSFKLLDPLILSDR